MSPGRSSANDELRTTTKPAASPGTKAASPPSPTFGSSPRRVWGAPGTSGSTNDSQSRRLTVAYDGTPSWAALDGLTAVADLDTAATPLLEPETFTTTATFDALGRPVTQTTPDASVTCLGYDDGGKLYSVSANVRGAVTPTDFVTSIEYDARGQRQRIEYGNGTRTTYEHDPLTFRLRRLHTTNTAGTVEHQDLRHTFDPVGNITEIRDLAQPVVFTSNAAVSADQRFTYDALYRLIEAEGREHSSQGQPVTDDFIPRAAPDDPTGLRAYVERYAYDLVGNILEVQHQAPGGNWTRHYQYAAAGNRLLATSAPGDGPGVFSHAYQYNAHGSMTAMPHLAAVEWDHADRMQSADLGGGGTVWFLYDSAGNRVRKIRVNQAGTSSYERVYVGGYEVYRERVSGDLELERQTLHVSDDTGRICLVETKTVDDGDVVPLPANTSRYQYGNHLGSVGMELDETGQLISYEEFHPYGTTAYRAANSAVDVSPSRYRYTGKERDEETGLGHHGARYYASWLGRWTAADPIGLGDGVNRFAYSWGNPVGMRDPNGTAATPGFEHLGVLVTTGRGSGGKGPTLLESEGGDPGLPPSPEREANREQQEAAQRAERRAARRAAREAKVLDATVNMAVAQYESLLRAEDAHRVEQLEKVADEIGFYPTGRVASYFEPGEEGPRRVDQFRSDLRRTLRQTEGRSLEVRIAALEKVNAKALAGIDWRTDAATDIAGFEAAATFGSAVMSRGQGRAPTPSAPKGGVNLDSSTARALVAQDSPVRHEIKAAIGNRQMVMTETAQAEFKTAVSRLAGPQEAARAERLMGRVNVVPDDPSARVAGLTLTKKVGANDRLIFGTGDKMGIQTLTSDAKFVRGAAAQGVDLNVLIHRAFSFLGL